VVVWAIGSEDEYADLGTYVEQMGLTYPLLYDEGAAVQDLYNPGRVPTNSKYPQDWIIGADGRVKYVNTIYDPDELMAVLDAELAFE
jgi:peroxiredoxin